MGSYQQQYSRSTVGIEPHIRQWKTYKKERARRPVKRERERWEKRYLWTIKLLEWHFFKYSSRIITIMSMLKSKFPPK